MEHDQRMCPRCGKPAGDFHFCPSGLAPVDSLPGVPAGDVAQSIAPVSVAAQTPPELLQIAEAANAGSTGDRSPGEAPAAVQVDPDPRPAEHDNASGGTFDIARLPSSADEFLGKAAQPSREVARLEDVLRVDDRDRIEARTAAAAARSVAPPPPSLAPETEMVWESTPEERYATAAGVTPPPRVAAESPARPEARVSAPNYVAAHRMRAAFLHEQASAFEQALPSKADDESDEPAAPAPRVSVPPPAPRAAEPTTGNEEPRLTEGDPCGSAQPDSSHRWLAALCLLALIALVVALTGRGRCRCSQ